MATIKVGQRGQITIPRKIRRYLSIGEGDTIALIPEGGQVIMRPIRLTLLDLRGSVPVSGVQNFDEIRKQVKVEIARRTGSDEP